MHAKLIFITLIFLAFGTLVPSEAAQGPVVPSEMARSDSGKITQGASPITALLDQARLWESRDRFDLARETLSKLFRIAPDHPDGLAMQGLLEVRENHLEAAGAIQRKLRQLAPEHPAIGEIETRLRLAGKDKIKLFQARLLARSRNTTAGQRGGAAEKALAAFRSLYPNGPPGGDLGLEYWQLVADTPQGWESARAGLAGLVRNNPDNLRYRFALAEHELSRPPLNRQALQTVIAMAQLPSFSREARATWQRAMMRLEPRPASIPLLQDYLRQEVGDTAVQEKLHSMVKALEAHRKMLADPFYQAKIEGLAQLESDRFAEAEELLARALAGRPNNVDTVEGMGLLRLRQGYHAEAVAYFRQAAHMEPGRNDKWEALIRTATFWGLLHAAGEAKENGELRLAEEKIQEALRLDPQEANGIAALAGVQVALGEISEAEKTFRLALRIEPVNRSALEGLIALHLSKGKVAEAKAVVSTLSHDQRTALGLRLNTIQAGILREEAELLLTEERWDEAMGVLEKATEIDPDDPWLCFKLARLYVAKNKQKEGAELFDNLLLRRPNDAVALYALALFLSGLDQDLSALSTLEKITEAERTTEMTQLQRRLWVRVQGERAKTFARGGQHEEAGRIMSQMGIAVGGDSDLTLQTAFIWKELGESGRGRKLLERVLAGPQEVLPGWHLRYAEYLASIGAEADFRLAMKRIASFAKLSPEEIILLTELRESAAVREVDLLLRDGRTDEAQQRLDPFLAAKPEQPRLLLLQAKIFRRENRLMAAETLSRQVLLLNPQNEDARQALVETMIQADKRAQAMEQIDLWLAQDDDGDPGLQLSLIGLLFDLEEYRRADEAVQRILAASPNHGKALVYAGKIAQQEGRLDEAITSLQRSLAAEQRERTGPEPLGTLSLVSLISVPETGESALVVEPAAKENVMVGRRDNDSLYRSLGEMLDQRTTWLSGAVDWRTRSGTAGISQFDSREIPVEWKSPWRANEQLFLRAETVKLAAGTVDMNDSAARSFGSLLLCDANCSTDLTRQSAEGMAISTGYERKDLRLDLGTPPLGFPVWHLTGGLLAKGDLGPGSYSVEASRRALTGSLLSYAGTRDPHTGTIWGGVVATGARLGLSLDQGGPHGLWSSLGWHQLTGENVQSNNRMQLMAGGYWRAINENDRQLSLGVTGMYWRFRENAGEYSFGHGGYYSPETYRSLSLPITFGQRYTRFAYQLRGSVSTSWAKVAAAPFYPTEESFQAQAEALSPLNGITPHYEASSGSGNGYAFSAAWEYQMTPSLFIGGRFDVERSDYYEPNRMMIYLRFAFDNIGVKPVSLPPQPLIPASQF